MIIKFNSIKQYERPIMTLCNPGSEYADVFGVTTEAGLSIGVISNTRDEEVIFNFNSTSELNFRTSKFEYDEEEQSQYINKVYNDIHARRLIYVEAIGYFVITQVNEMYSRTEKAYKDVSAESIEIELGSRKMPYIEDGTYTLSDLLETIFKGVPKWKLLDLDAIAASKHRTFKDIDEDKNILSFLMEDLQDAYECIFSFDITRRLVSVYDQASYVKEPSISLTMENFIDTVGASENSNDLYTAISALGENNMNVSGINPNGSNVIYDFTHYLSWMSEELAQKVSIWQQEIDLVEKEFRSLSESYFTQLDVVTDKQLDIERCRILSNVYQRARDNIVADGSNRSVKSYNTVIQSSGGEPILILPDIKETLSSIDARIREVEAEVLYLSRELSGEEVTLSNIDTQISAIRSSLSISNYFTTEEQEELQSYIYEGTYNDEYVIFTNDMSFAERFEQMGILYDRAKSTLQKASSPGVEFSVDTESFVFSNVFSDWTEELETGRAINVEVRKGEIVPLFLSNISVNYDDQNVNLTFGSKYDRFDPKSIFEDVLGDVKKSANSLSFIKDVIYPLRSGDYNKMREDLKASRDLTMNAALASEGEEILIDGSGYTGRTLLEDGTYDPRQLKLTGKNIVFTDDNWLSSKAALGEIILPDGKTGYGISAELIMGDLLVGSGLRIVDENGNDLINAVTDSITLQVTTLSDKIARQGEETSKDLSDIKDGFDAYRNDVDVSLTQIRQDSESINFQVSSLIGQQGKAEEVVTSTGYRFDQDGLHISKHGEEIANKIDNLGMRVIRSGEDVLVADNNGVNALNLTAREYLTIGENSRIEDYISESGEKRTAVYFIGE